VTASAVSPRASSSSSASLFIFNSRNEVRESHKNSASLMR
jgi:hypothetical protein